MAGLNRGGLETFIMNVYRQIDRSKIQFDFLTHQPDGDYAEEVKSLGGRIFSLPPRNKGFQQYYKALDIFFAEYANEYAAVHLHVSSLSMASSLYYAKKYGIKIRILHSHSSSISASKFHYILHCITKPFVKNLATNYLGCSDKALDWLYNGSGVRKQAVMISNGIDVENFKYNEIKRNKIRQSLGLDNMTVIGHVGRFYNVKNQPFLVSTFFTYHKLNPKSKLMLIGTGESINEVKVQVEQLGLTNDVLFMGVRSDIPDLLQAMDIFVMPSLFEGLPVSLVEAQTAGLPVLATDVISHDTNMTDGFHYMSLAKTSKEWANEIDRILNSYIRRDTTKEIAAKGFDIKETANILSKIYTHGE